MFQVLCYLCGCNVMVDGEVENRCHEGESVVLCPPCMMAWSLQPSERERRRFVRRRRRKRALNRDTWNDY
jgi:hypothetical protein